MGYQEPLRRMLDDMREESAANALVQEEAQTISKTLSSDKTLFVSKWTDYDRDDVVSLWRATCLSVGLNPDHKAARSEDFAKRVVALGFAKDDCIKGLKEVLRRYKNVLINAKNPNSDLSTADELRKTIELSAFGRWAAKKKDWELPKGFPGTPSPLLNTDQPNLTSVSPELVADENAFGDVELDKAGLVTEPWLVIDPKDPVAIQPWYTPARYFARQLVIKDSTLLQKRNVLAKRVSKSLADTGFKKRGGKLPLDSGTVLKAFSKICWG